jgi:ParB family transcriptional regulator, chromosome partitioning protein
MNVKKHGLGKGLGALIPDESGSGEIEEGIRNININLIKPNEEQPRRRFDEEKIAQLGKSIKEHGVIQPLVLKKKNDTYVIVAGERRFRAAKSIGLAEVPAVIMELDDKEVLEISLIENIQREDLNPIEEAMAYKRLVEEFNLIQEDLAERLGKSRSVITNTMRLLNLDYRVQDALINVLISEGHGRVLLAIEDKQLQYVLSQKIIKDKLSVRETERLIKEISTRKTKRRASVGEDPYYSDIKDKLENYFGTKITLNTGKNKGKIEIEYYSEEDLQRILDILNI